MKKKNKITALVLFLVLLLGLSLLLYPVFSNYINKPHQTSVSSNYVEGITELNEEDYSSLFEAAEEYNRKLNDRTNPFTLTDDLKEQYNKMLSIPGSDVIAMVDIPYLGVSLPIYHGTSDGVLQQSVGHIEWSSLPIGGEDTHAILCGHRGLPSSKLFTDLDKLTVGDVFTVTVLNRVLTYDVDQVRIVEPGDVKD